MEQGNVMTLIGLSALRLSPYLHALVILGVFISVATNLLSTFYSATLEGAAGTWPWGSLAAAVAMVLAAWRYLPIVGHSERVARDAGSRPGLDFEEAIQQILAKPEERKIGVNVGNRVIQAGAFVVVGALALVYWR